MEVARRDASVQAYGKWLLGNGLWEVRTDLPTKRTARVFLCLYEEHLIALHGFIKKTQATPVGELAIARKRQKEIEQ